MIEDQQAEARQILRVDPQTAAPTRAAADGPHLMSLDFNGRIVVRHPAPILRRADRVHDAGLQNIGQASAEQTQQRQRKPVNANVVVLVKRTRLLNRARLPFACPELLGANKIRVLAPQRAFPLAFLLEVVFPGDLGVVRRIVAAVVDVLRDRIVDVLDQPAFDSKTADSG